jgi:hypothetical protein
MQTLFSLFLILSPVPVPVAEPPEPALRQAAFILELADPKQCRGFGFYSLAELRDVHHQLRDAPSILFAADLPEVEACVQMEIFFTNRRQWLQREQLLFGEHNRAAFSDALAATGREEFRWHQRKLATCDSFNMLQRRQALQWLWENPE